MRDAVMEIRTDVKDLAKTIARVDREGSMGTKQELSDHETRIRSLEVTDSRLAGSWAAFAVLGSGIAGLAGISLGVLALLSN